MNKRKDKQRNEQKANQQLALTNQSNNVSAIDSKKEKEEKFDPFKRTGCLFGALVREVRIRNGYSTKLLFNILFNNYYLTNKVEHRYSQYFSDIRDGLNLHCLISFFFIFTVCVAPALCFGGILGKLLLLKKKRNENNLNNSNAYFCFSGKNGEMVRSKRNVVGNGVEWGVF